MIFNPFSLCYGRFENEEDGPFSKMESDIKRIGSKNDLQFYKKNTHECLKMHGKFVTSLNVSSKKDHDMKIDNHKIKFSRKFDEHEQGKMSFDRAGNAKPCKHISTISPSVKPIINTFNVNSMDTIVDKLKELECLVKNILIKIDNDSQVTGLKVQQIVKSQILQVLSESTNEFQTLRADSKLNASNSLDVDTTLKSSSNSLDDTNSLNASNSSKSFESSKATNSLEANSTLDDSNMLNVANEKSLTREKKALGDSNVCRGIEDVQPSLNASNELRLRECSTGVDDDILYKEPSYFRADVQSKYIDRVLADINASEGDSVDYSIERRLELESIKEWACKSTGIGGLGIADIYSFDESDQLVTSNLVQVGCDGSKYELTNGSSEHASSNPLGDTKRDAASNEKFLTRGETPVDLFNAIEDQASNEKFLTRDTATNVEKATNEASNEERKTFNDQELALSNLEMSVVCRSRSMPSIDFAEEPMVSMTSFSSISKLETLSIESDLSICTAN